jgi:hypothetical protein
VLRTSGVDACEVRFTVSVEGDAVHDLGVLDCERR